MDLPSQIDSHLEVIQTGVESEEVEEINDAYKDILEELGIHLEKKLICTKVNYFLKKIWQ